MILAVFVAIAVIGQALNVALCLALDSIFSPTVGALTFVLLYMGVFAISWMIALRIVEGRAGKQVPRMQPRIAEQRSAEPRFATRAG